MPAQTRETRLESAWEGLLSLVRAHEAYALPIVFTICMAESIIGISLLVPSTAIMLAMSTVLGASGADMLALWLAAGLGASLGDWISYALGYFFEHELHERWPLKNNKELVARGHAFFERWGWASLFVSRFLGPLRSLTPLVAGICEMPLIQFGVASFVSAMLWAGVILAPGGLGGGLLLGSFQP
jgi:membrane protein DedA with SNARE-associated domain